MPDTTTIPGAEGGGARSSGPNWVMWIGGALALIVVLYYVMKASGGGSSQTTAAGTSINAALGSIQEENLNLMGQLGQTQGNILAGQAGLSSQMDTTSSALSGQLSSVGGEVTQSEADLMGQLNQVNSNVMTGNQATTDLGTTLGQDYNALTGQIGGVATGVNNLNGAVNSAASQENQYYNGLTTQYGTLSQELQNAQTALANDIGQLVPTSPGTPSTDGIFQQFANKFIVSPNQQGLLFVDAGGGVHPSTWSYYVSATGKQAYNNSTSIFVQSADAWNAFMRNASGATLRAPGQTANYG